MSRKRATDHHLPTRVYFRSGRYRYIDPAGKAHTLGKEWDRAAREEHDRLTRGSAAPQTVSALLDAFLIHREGQVRAGEASAKTLETNEYEASVLRLVFGQMPANAVKRPHIARYLRERADRNGRPAPVRANREKALLSSAFSWAMGLRDWDIPENPCYGVRNNKEKPRTRYIGTSELAGWKRHAPKWLRAYVLLKRLSGARQAEMLSLSMASLTDAGVMFEIGKTRRRKLVRWSWAVHVAVNSILSLHKPPKKVVQLVKPTPKAELPLFRSRFDRAMSARGFKSQWARSMAEYIAAGGIRFREHDIRAKTASDLSLSRAQELLDHASPAMTKGTYQRATTKVRPLR